MLAGIDYNDERKLGDARNRDVVLGRLVQHFSKLSLRNTDLSEPDMLGRAYEYLIEKFADDAGKKGGEFYTPRMVVRLIVEMLAPKEGMRICDPTAGSGGMLIECAHHLERHKQNPRNLSLFGQEKNLGTWAICKMNMLLHGLPDARIEKGDTIRDPKLREGGELMLFDRVIANPPFSLDEWGQEIAEHDPYGRFRFGVPPNTKGDLAFVQHMIATTNGTGMVGVVMSHGVLFRGAAEGAIRKGILQEDLVEAVVGLPVNLFYGTGIPAAILIINRAKKAERKGKVLFIEGSREFGSGTNQNTLRETDVKKIVAAFRAFADVPKYARTVGLEEIEQNDFNLNMSRYIETADAAEKVDVRNALAHIDWVAERLLREVPENLSTDGLVNDWAWMTRYPTTLIDTILGDAYSLFSDKTDIQAALAMLRDETRRSNEVASVYSNYGFILSTANPQQRGKLYRMMRELATKIRSITRNAKKMVDTVLSGNYNKLLVQSGT